MLRFLNPCFVFNHEICHCPYVCGNTHCMHAIVRKVLTFLMSLDEFGDEKKNMQNGTRYCR